jgi:hypothetical protein
VRIIVQFLYQDVDRPGTKTELFSFCTRTWTFTVGIIVQFLYQDVDRPGTKTEQ